MDNNSKNFNKIYVLLEYLTEKVNKIMENNQI